MATSLSPYLSFRDTARAAMELYRSVLGGELTITTFGEFGISEDPAEQDKVMHSQLTTPGGLVLMASDTPNAMELAEGSAHSVALFGADLAELRGCWTGLVDGGTVTAPFETAPWGDTFGMCIDRFGISWMVNAEGTPAG